MLDNPPPPSWYHAITEFPTTRKSQGGTKEMSQMFPRQPHEPDVVGWLTRKALELITGKPVPRDDDDDDDSGKIYYPRGPVF